MWTGVTGPHWIRHLTEFPSDCTEFRETFPFETALGHGQVQGRNRRWSFSHSGILPRKDTGSFLFSKKPISRRRRWLGADYNRHRYGRGLAGRTKNRTQQKKSRKENRKAIDTHTHTHTHTQKRYLYSFPLSTSLPSVDWRPKVGRRPAAGHQHGAIIFAHRSATEFQSVRLVFIECHWGPHLHLPRFTEEWTRSYRILTLSVTGVERSGFKAYCIFIGLHFYWALAFCVSFFD